MKKTAPLTLFALALGMAGVAVAQDALTERQVRTQLEQQGYTKVHDLKFRDGMWKAIARSGDGTKVSVRIDPKTGQAFPDAQVSRLSERDVRASLSSEGYTHVHDVDYRDGMWRARAENNAGKDVKLQIDADSGRVVGTD